MQEVVIKGKKRLCFVLATGETNTIVIQYDGLTGIDYKRLVEIESRGGNMLKNMRDTICDNGVNALKMYKGMIVVVPKPQEAKTAEGPAPSSVVPPVRKRPGPKPKAEREAATHSPDENE